MLITTATFQDAIEAHIIRGRMEVEGINTVVSFQHQLLLLRLANVIFFIYILALSASLRALR